MDVEIRPIAAEEYDAWTRAAARAFGSPDAGKEASLKKPRFPFERSLAAFDDREVVGTTYTHRSEARVPGGWLPAAIVEDVAVLPTHRRRGILTRLMVRQLADLREEAVPLAMLGASESVIYGRFGYGIGALQEDWTIAREHNAFAFAHDRPGRLRFVEPDEARTAFPEVSDRACAGRPGYVKLSDSWWDVLLADLEPSRGGASALFHLAYEEDGRIDGYVLYRIRRDALVVIDLMAATENAYVSLWRFCFDVDLMALTEAPGRPLDDPLPWMLADSRRLRRSTRDAMWLRLVDVSTALSARRYARDGTLVLDVRDALCPWNQGGSSWRGEPMGPNVAHPTCLPTSSSRLPIWPPLTSGPYAFPRLPRPAASRSEVPGRLSWPTACSRRVSSRGAAGCSMARQQPRISLPAGFQSLDWPGVPR